MNALLRFLFPVFNGSQKSSLLLLAARIAFGLLFMTHGIQKWANFDTLSATFPDPLGIGSQGSLVLAIFGELICSVAFIFGLFHRIVLLPMIFTMIMAFFVIHGSDPLADRELSLLYMIIFVLLYITGPGRYSIDHYIGKAQAKRKKDHIFKYRFLYI